MKYEAAVFGQDGGLVTIGHAAFEATGPIEPVVDAVDAFEDTGVEGDADGELSCGNANGFQVAYCIVCRLSLLRSGVQGRMVP
jgi:hypothetical protein